MPVASDAAHGVHGPRLGSAVRTGLEFGMVKDRFGCHWIVNAELIDMRLAA